MGDFYGGQLQRSSLGRLAFIGELYDVRNESLSSRSLFKSSFPTKSIECLALSRMEFDYKFTQNISDRFELIDTAAELQMSVLLGLINLEGSGKFLTEEIKSEKTVSCSLICKLQTVAEKMFISFDEILQHVDLTALEDPQYTHVIVEMIWGANCILSLERTCKSDSEKQKIQGSLLGEMSLLKKCLVGGGKFNCEMEKSSLSNKSDVSIKIYADVVPDKGWPTSAGNFCEFVSDLPRLLKGINDGKGRPLSYVMIPLSSIRKVAKLDCAIDVFVTKIQESFLLSTIYFFEEVTQIKKKLNDLLAEMNENKKYTEEEELRSVRNKLEELTYKEARLKLLILEDWVLVRSGQKPLRDLIRQVEKLKNYELNLLSYEEYFKSHSATLSKLERVKDYIAKGIIYLGKEEKFYTVQSKYLSSEFVVLVISSQMEKADPELYRNTCYYFLTEAAETRADTKYVVVDLDYAENHFLNEEIKEARCYHMKGNKILSRDLYGDYLKDLERSFVQLKKGVTMNYALHKPGNRVAFKTPCPGAETGTCSFEPVVWICSGCRNIAEYGFDDYFYCFCGKGPVASLEYRCNNATHGNFFIPAKPEFLKNFLSNLRPLPEMNLLLLGQSGVGKSTWINSIINYLTYDSLDTAKECGVLTTIPSSFVMYDSKTLKKHLIHVGQKSENEVTEVGESATQFSHSYNFIWENTCVRLIDTPGLGDTRGIDHDRENVKNIIDHLGYLKELHGVCILLKANDNRITAIFAYCLKELLVHLHKSVAKNIIFCFTNARNSFYSPGQTSAVLEKVIAGIGVKKEISLGYHNMFCLDNEAFLFLCSLECSEIHYSDELLKSFRQSWQISLNETRRLFNAVKTFTPHQLTETISLFTARNRVLSLTKPIAEINKTILINVTSLEKNEQEINASDLAIEKLSKKLQCFEIRLVATPLKYPRTVCTSPSCVEYLPYQSLDLSHVEYKTHCHLECYLNKVVPKSTNNALLKNCTAMNHKGICKVCGCSWENHMHLTVSQKRVEIPVVNTEVENDLIKEKSAKEKILGYVENLKSTIAKYQREQEFIIQASVKFGIFLQKNAISCYNDSVAEYLKYLIKEEENKPYKTGTEETLLESMRKTLSHYKSEVKILQDVIRNGDNSNIEELSPEDVFILEQKLYELELTGEEIRRSVEAGRVSNDRMSRYLETPVQLAKAQKPEGKFRRYQKTIMKVLRNNENLS